MFILILGDVAEFILRLTSRRSIAGHAKILYLLSLIISIDIIITQVDNAGDTPSFNFQDAVLRYFIDIEIVLHFRGHAIRLIEKDYYVARVTFRNQIYSVSRS